MKKESIFGGMGGFINGFFGSGGGTVMLYPMQKAMADKKKANATCLAIVVPMTVISIILYMLRGNVDWGLSFKVCIGGIIGGVVGAKLLGRVKYGWILLVYCGVTVFGGLVMIFRR